MDNLDLAKAESVVSQVREMLGPLSNDQRKHVINELEDMFCSFCGRVCPRQEIPCRCLDGEYDLPTELKVFDP